MSQEQDCNWIILETNLRFYQANLKDQTRETLQENNTLNKIVEH